MECSTQLEHHKAGSHHVGRAIVEIPSPCHCCVVQDVSQVQSAKAVIQVLNWAPLTLAVHRHLMQFAEIVEKGAFDLQQNFESVPVSM